MCFFKTTLDQQQEFLKPVVVVGLVLVAFGIQMLLRPLFGERPPYLLIFPAIVVSAWLGGVRLGVLATGLAAVLTLLVPTRAGAVTLSDSLPLVLFVGEGTLVSFLTGYVRLSRERTFTSMRDRQARFEVALRTARMSVYTTDRDLRYTWVHNPHPDFPPEMLMGKRDDELLPPEAVADLVAFKQRVIDSGVGEQKTITTAFAGKAYTFIVTAEPLRDVRGNVQGLTVAVLDVTERERVNAALRDREEKFRVALKHAPIIVAQVDRDLRYTWMYTAHPKLDPEKAIGKRDDELGSKGAEQLLALKRRVLTSGEGERQRITFEASDGDPLVYDITAEPLFDDEGAVIGVTTAAMDITESEKMHAELRRSENLRRLALEAAEMGTWVSKLNQNAVSWDQQARRIFGVAPDDPATMEKGFDITHPDDRQRAREKFNAAVAPDSSGDYDVEKRIVQADGTVRWVAMKGKVISDESGGTHKPSHLLGVVMDVTDRKKTEQRNHLLQTLAATLSRTMSHDELIEVIIQQGINGTGATAGTIALVSKDGNNLAIADIVGDSEHVPQAQAYIPLHHPTELMALALRENKRLWIPSPEARRQLTASAFTGSQQGASHQAWAVLPFTVNDEAIGAISLSFDTPREFDQAERAFLVSLTDYCAQALVRAQLTEEIRQLAAVEERQRLSRDLHDSVKQMLFAANMIARSLPDVWEDAPPMAQEHVRKVTTLNRAALAEMHTLLLEMRPNAIVKTPFDFLLENLNHGLKGRKDITVNLTYDGPEELYLPADTHVTLYRLCQEALTNVTKHSEAAHVDIDCTYRNGVFRLGIRDNGRGFDVDHVSMGMGLNSMRERAKAVGATLDIHSEAERGTQVVVEWQQAEATTSG